MLNKLTDFQKRVLSYPAIILLSISSSIVIHSLVISTDFAPGGISGIAAMISYATDFNMGVLVFIFNIPLVIMSIFLLGGEFTVKSIIGVVTFSTSLYVLDVIKFPVYKPEQTLIAAIAGGAIDAFNVALIFKMAGSMGGTDFVAAAIYKKNSHINITWFVFGMNVLIALVSIFVYNRGIEPAILSIIMTFVASKVVDSIMTGFKSAVKFEIITEKPQEIKQALFDHVERGVTIIPVKGAYSNTDRFLILCIVKRSEIPHLQKVLRDFEGTFSIQSNVYNVYGNKFASIKQSKSGL